MRLPASAFRGACVTVARLLVVGVVLVATFGCAEERGTPEMLAGDDSMDDVRIAGREFVDLTWDTVWTVGGSEEDDRVLYPNGAMAVDSNHLYLLDPGDYRVTALGLADGNVAWTRGRRGRGPGEFRSLRGLSLLGEDEIVVLDGEVGRLVILGRDGRYRDNIISNEETGQFDSVCGFRDGTLLALSARPERPLVLLGRDGRVLQDFAYPWPDLADASSLVRFLTLIPSADGRACLAALTGGRGFVWYDAETRTFGSPAGYVEWFDVSGTSVERRTVGDTRITTERLNSYRQAVVSGVVENGVAEILFGGTTGDAYRLVDVYEAPAGEYLRSYRLPSAVSGFARSGDLHFVTAKRDGYPVVLALRPRMVDVARE